MSVLFTLAKNFFFLSLVSVGGASAIISEIQRVFVDTLHLITREQFLSLFAVSQASPGPNVMFVALFGWQIAGFAGAITSMLAMCGPTVSLALGVEYFGNSHREKKWYCVVRSAMTPIAIGLLCSSSVVLVENSSHIFAAILMAGATLIVILKFSLNPMWMIGLGALLGMTGIL